MLKVLTVLFLISAVSCTTFQFSGAQVTKTIPIEYEASFIDLLLNGVTFGIYAPATARIKGTVVKYSGMLPGIG